MRAMKSSIEIAGKLKQQYPAEDESSLVVHALREANFPRLLKDDQVLFNGLAQDLFPKAKEVVEENRRFVECIRKAVTESNHQATPSLVVKVQQLLATVDVRNGTIVIGPTLSSKSTIITALQKALNAYSSVADQAQPASQLHQKGQELLYEHKQVEITTIHPKALSIGELYGEENALTKDWNDGLASYCLRQATNGQDDRHQWVLFDGQVDPSWIESLNSVLDDSRFLCLANGQRIRVKKEVKVLFEAEDLSSASPSTVSRCGVVYVPDNVIGWQALVRSWMSSSFMS